MKNKPKIKCFADYILLVPDKPKSGTFDVGDRLINETAIVQDCGPLCSDEVRDIIGKRVSFSSWKCEDPTIDGVKYYLVPESSNVIRALI